MTGLPKDSTSETQSVSVVKAPAKLTLSLHVVGVRNDGFKAFIGQTGLSEPAFLMFFFAGFAFVAALAFALYARTYPMQDNYRTAA